MDFENGEAEVDKSKENCSSTNNNHSKIESMKTEINHVLLGQQMTCEILTNLCCDTEQDGESWEEGSDDMNSSDLVRLMKNETKSLFNIIVPVLLGMRNTPLNFYLFLFT